MLRKLGLKLGFLVIVVGSVIPVSAAPKPGAISGYVRNSTGAPQMGAAVEVLGSAFHSFKVFTDENGFYSASGVIPGVYSLKVSAPSFLPALRERVALRAGASVVVNVTLNTLFEAIQLGPMRGPADDEDWKWVLRSSANRPILRMLPDGTAVTAANSEQSDRDLKGTLSFVAGSPSGGGFGSTSDMNTGFAVEKSIFSSGMMAVYGEVGYGSGSAMTVVRISYTHKSANGSQPKLAFTMRRLAAPEMNGRSTVLQALALTSSDDFTVGDVLELKFGSELQTIQFMGRVNAFRPFGSVDLHLSPDAILEYSYATSVPDSRLDKGFDTAPADLSESGPRMSLSGFAPRLEKAHHHEVSFSRRLGKPNVQVAMFSDRVVDPALTGVGDLASDSGDVLPDLYSGTFTYRGKELDTRGMRLVLQQKLASDLTATLDYSYGGVLDLGKSDVSVEDAHRWLRVKDRQSVAAKFSGTLPGAKTRWMASYRWTDGPALTPVDMLTASAVQANPFLNPFAPRATPNNAFRPCHRDASLDFRNLRPPGYVPVMGQDGRTVYLVQSARAIRGGVAFTF